MALAGAIAIHLILGVFADALVVLNPVRPPEPPAPQLELVDIEPPPVVKPPPPPPPETPEPPAPEPVKPAVQPQKVATRASTHAEPPPASEPPPQVAPTPGAEGGGPVVAMDDVAPAATGVAVAKGPTTRGHIGRGGTGTGTGTGSGSGSEVAPMSVATIKTRAMPRGDYAYEESKDYPAEARQLGIEGKIRVKLVVDAAGSVKSAVLLNKLGHGLDELALSRAEKIAFDPAKDTDDKPVASVVVWTFNMALPK